MNYTILALVGYILWTMLLILALAGYRTTFNKQQNRTSLKFDANGSDVGDLGQRITRAHANCYESFSFVGGTMVLALATSASAITNSLALVVLAARIAQSIVHIISTSNLAVTIRFVFFLIQFVICGYWLVLILLKFL